MCSSLNTESELILHAKIDANVNLLWYLMSGEGCVHVLGVNWVINVIEREERVLEQIQSQIKRRTRAREACA
jgi:hypothetical protein